MSDSLPTHLHVLAAWAHETTTYVVIAAGAASPHRVLVLASDGAGRWRQAACLDPSDRRRPDELASAWNQLDSSRRTELAERALAEHDALLVTVGSGSSVCRRLV